MKTVRPDESDEATDVAGYFPPFARQQMHPILRLAALFLLLPVLLGMGTPAELSPQEASAQITAQEDALLAQLRALQLDMDRKQAEAAVLEAERTALLRERGQLLQEQAAVGRRHEEYRTALAGMLASWQTAGPGSRLELLLTSESLSVFLRRLSAMRQLDRDFASLLADLEATEAALAAGEARLCDTLEDVAQKEQQLSPALAERQTKKTELETSLASLRADRDRYEAMLAELAETWAQAMTVFPALTKGFAEVIAAGGFPEDALDVLWPFRHHGRPAGGAVPGDSRQRGRAATAGLRVHARRHCSGSAGGATASAGPV
jgi:peptidoglycan hydrolase CwlO-like protein